MSYGKTVKKTISQPEDWWQAWEVQAFKAGLHLSEWIAEQCNSQVPEKTRAKLSERTPRGRRAADSELENG